MGEENRKGKKCFTGETLHFVTMGAHDYIGELDTSEHPLGDEWWRIKNPCITFMRENPNAKEMTQVVANMAGLKGAAAYRKRLDIKIETILEIKTLDKNGPLTAFYKEELNKEVSSLYQRDRFGGFSKPS